MNPPKHIDFRAASQRVPPGVPSAVQRATTRLIAGRAAAVALVPEWESLRQQAHDLRLNSLLHLDELVAQVERAVQAAGGQVHHAKDAAAANAIVTRIAHERGVKTAVKSKSMASEEIGLNHALEQAGVRAVETDVGEFIIQLAGDRPSHILGPTLHMSKEEIAALFTAKLRVDAPPDPRRLTDIARDQLRREFLRAEMGISGANFVVAESGTVVLLTNEGNGRLCTTLPEIHVAVAGIDKLIPDWDSLAILLRLLARNATGQKMPCHTSFITGPRRAALEGGPREFHLVLLDNGRRRIAQDAAARETLLCIRCAACLNICPVYNHTGGHAYGWVYSGPIGAILSPQLLGMQAASSLPFASTLCGACVDVCPVKIPITDILLNLRRRAAEGNEAEHATVPPVLRLGARLGVAALGTPALYRLASRLAELVQVPWRRGEWLPVLPPPLNRWTQTRPFPEFRPQFRRWWRESKRNEVMAPPRPTGVSEVASSERVGEATAGTARPQATAPAASREREIDTLIGEINRLSGKAQRVSQTQLTAALQELVETERITSATLWTTDSLRGLDLEARLGAIGVKVVPGGRDKHTLAEVDLGITEVDWALPESGSLGLLASPDKPRETSLLPRIHLAIMRPSALRESLPQLLAEARVHPYLVLVTGLSRTSDIESSPVLGAHGPQALYVWVMDAPRGLVVPC